MKDSLKKMAVAGIALAAMLASASAPVFAYDRYYRYDRGGCYPVWHKARGCVTRCQPEVYHHRHYYAPVRYVQAPRHHRGNDVATAAVVTAAASLIAIGTIAAISGY